MGPTIHSTRHSTVKHGHNELAISERTKLILPIIYNCIAKGKLIIGRRTWCFIPTKFRALFLWLEFW